MRCLMWLGPHRMSVEEVDAPAAGSGEVVISVGAVGICGSELSGYLGQNSLRQPPLIMGHEFSGEIVGVGEGVAAPGIGDRVTVNPLWRCGDCPYCAAGMENLCPRRVLVGAHRPGAFADLVAVPADCCHALPAGVDWVSGSLVEPAACGVRAIRAAGLGPGQPLAILGAGPMGLMALFAARAVGAGEVAVFDLNRRRLRVLESYGVRTYDASEPDAVAACVADLGGSPPAVVDCVGVPATRRQAFELVRPGGTVVFLGLHENETSLPINDIIRAEVRMAGSFSYAARDFAAGLELVVSGRVRPDAQWLRVRPLADGPEAFEQLVDGSTRDAVTKIVLEP